MQEQDFVFTSQANSFPPSQNTLDKLLKVDVNTFSWQSRINKPHAWAGAFSNRKTLFKQQLSSDQLSPLEQGTDRKLKIESDYYPTFPKYIPLGL